MHDRPLAMRPAFFFRTEQVPICVGVPAAKRNRAIGAIGQRAEADQDGGSAGVAGVSLGDLENRAAGMCVDPGGRRTFITNSTGQLAIRRSDYTAERTRRTEADGEGGNGGEAGGGV